MTPDEVTFLDAFRELGIFARFAFAWGVRNFALYAILHTALTTFFAYAITHSLTPLVVSKALSSSGYPAMFATFATVLCYPQPTHPLILLALCAVCGYNALQIAVSEQVTA